MRILNHLSSITLAGLLCASAAPPAPAGGDYEFTWRTIDGSGGTSTGGEFVLHGTIAQPDAGTLASVSPDPDYVLRGGFWFGIKPTSTTANIEIELAGVNQPSSRCIQFILDDCNAVIDVTIEFTDHDGDDANGDGDKDSAPGNPSTPVRAITTIDLPEGIWSSLCAKDQQHSLWSTSSLDSDVDGKSYQTTSMLSLIAGDIDNDGNVDIHDITAFIAMFGELAPPGSCPWDGVADGDFNNNGAVGTEDYSLLSAAWLEFTTCTCMFPLAGSFDERTTIAVNELQPWIAERVDLDNNGVFDFMDVLHFESRENLPHTLSMEMSRGAR